MGAKITQPTCRAMMKTGTYTGNGIDDRNIDIGVNLAAKSDVYIVIKEAGGNEAQHRIEYGQGDLTMRFDNAADAADIIQAVTATGFQIGQSAKANANGVVYRYVVFWAEI